MAAARRFQALPRRLWLSGHAASSRSGSGVEERSAPFRDASRGSDNFSKAERHERTEGGRDPSCRPRYPSSNLSLPLPALQDVPRRISPTQVRDRGCDQWQRLRNLRYLVLRARFHQGTSLRSSEPYEYSYKSFWCRRLGARMRHRTCTPSWDRAQGRGPVDQV